MDEEIERLVIGVRADTSGLERDVAAMRSGLEGPLAAGSERAGRAIEGNLLRAVRSGQLGFEELRRGVLSVMDAIAAASLRTGVETLVGGSLGQVLAGVVSGAPGRATGGPVSPGRAYRVGERGPELFVPTTSGTVVASGGASAREVRVAITVNAPAGAAPEAMARSGRQVARAVRAALEEA
jgi:hypothetical protein